MGQPGRSQGRSSPARAKQTRGTETSKYPEEEKATAIPLVAASERGPAQTRRACTAGVVGPPHGSTTPNRSGLERRSEEHTSELQSQSQLACRLLPEKKNELERLQLRSSRRTLYGPLPSIA